MGQASVPGLLYVPMALKSGTSVQEIDDWYNNEHVPIRMRLPYFQTGSRYRAVDNRIREFAGSALHDDQIFTWLALYDISDMRLLRQTQYERLLQPEVQGAREHGILRNKVMAFKKSYDLVRTYEGPGYVPMEEVFRSGDANEAFGRTLIVVGVELSGRNGPEEEIEWDRWYEEDHLPSLRKVPGWLRTRRYRTSVVEYGGGEALKREYLTLNEFAKDNAIGGPEHQIAIATEKRTNVVANKWRRTYKLHYIQGMASRDLTALQRQDVCQSFSPDGLTRSLSGPRPSIESYVKREDGMTLPYCFQGTGEARASVIVLFTVAGLPWSVWDTLADKLFASPTGRKSRILRVSLPIRSEDTDKSLETLLENERMVKDLDACFNALMIGRADVLLGVGIGGRTVKGASRGLLTVSKEAFNPSLMKLCENGLFVVAPDPEGLDMVLSANIASLSGHDQPLAQWLHKVRSQLEMIP